MDIVLVYEGNSIEAIDAEDRVSIFRSSGIVRVLSELKRLEANIVQIVYAPIHPPKGVFVRQTRR